MQRSISEQSLQKEYVSIAISILTKPDGEIDARLRTWAVDLLNAKSPVKLDAATAEILKSGEVILPT